MCGIFGELNFDFKSSSQHMHELAVNTLKHRGPDEYGFWQAEGIFLGMRRLSIIDLSSGSQPIWNENNTSCIVYNGELYNFMDLRSQLEAQGHLFRTNSDTEVVLHAYEEWGADCLERFNGMFAFAIWDNRCKKLFLARDRMGEKPLYYYQDDKRMVFASEIKAMLVDSTIPREINSFGLVNFLTYGHSLAPETIYKRIYKLLPGHFIVVENGKIRISQYWDIGKQKFLNPKFLSKKQFADQIRDLLDDSVRRRMVADVPVGAFLSGGLDSSAIVALMMKHSKVRVKTFSLGFDSGRGNTYNELDDAALIANRLGTEHYGFKVNGLDLIKTIKDLVYFYDEPFADAASIPIFLLSQFAVKHVKVVLTGEGGDELFGGYRRYRVEKMAALYRITPGFFKNRLIPEVLKKLGVSSRKIIALKSLSVEDPLVRYLNWCTVINPLMQKDILQTDFYKKIDHYNPVDLYRNYYHNFNSFSKDKLNQLIYMDLKTWLVDTYLEKVDKATMASGLEARLPILDYRLVELAFQIPGRYKSNNFSTKDIFRRAVKNIIPKEVLHKPKHGFSVPVSIWLREGLKNFVSDVLLDERLKRRGFFDTAEIEKMLQEHIKGNQDLGEQLWVLLNFELWCRAYIDGKEL